MDLIYHPGRIVCGPRVSPPIAYPVIATGLLTALPFLTLLTWGLIAPQAVLTSRRIVASFVCCSYLMVALGVWWGFTLIPQTMALLMDLSRATL
jgi:Sec-independent protein secretion pathway component TatC